MPYDEMYIHLEHILLVIIELNLAKTLFFSNVFYLNTVGTSWMILNVTEVKVFVFKQPLFSIVFLPKLYNQLCLATISVSLHLFVIVMIHKPSLEVSKENIIFICLPF